MLLHTKSRRTTNICFNFSLRLQKKSLAELALADKAAIVENKIFNGLVEDVSPLQLKEITLLEQPYVKAEDGKRDCKGLPYICKQRPEVDQDGSFRS